MANDVQMDKAFKQQTRALQRLRQLEDDAYKRSQNGGGKRKGAEIVTKHDSATNRCKRLLNLYNEP
jgi:hypothetical protein